MKKFIVLLIIMIALMSCRPNNTELYTYVHTNNGVMYLYEVYLSESQDTIIRKTLINEWEEGYYMSNYPSYHEEILNVHLVK